MIIEIKKSLELGYAPWSTTNHIVLEPGRYEAERIPNPTGESSDPLLVIHGIYRREGFEGFRPPFRSASYGFRKHFRPHRSPGNPVAVTGAVTGNPFLGPVPGHNRSYPFGLTPRRPFAVCRLSAHPVKERPSSSAAADLRWYPAS